MINSDSLEDVTDHLIAKTDYLHLADDLSI